MCSCCGFEYHSNGEHCDCFACFDIDKGFDENGIVVWFPSCLHPKEFCYCMTSEKYRKRRRRARNRGDPNDDGGEMMGCLLMTAFWLIAIIIWWLFALILRPVQVCGFCRRPSKRTRNTPVTILKRKPNIIVDYKEELPTTTVPTGAPQSFATRGQQPSGLAKLPYAPHTTRIEQVEVEGLPQWWETCTDPSGRVYYRNHHKRTTSWNLPSPEEIALETEERRAQVTNTSGEPSAPPYDARPPAY